MSGKETSRKGCGLAARTQTKSLTGDALAPLRSDLGGGGGRGTGGDSVPSVSLLRWWGKSFWKAPSRREICRWCPSGSLRDGQRAVRTRGSPVTPPEDQGRSADTGHLASRRKIGLLILKRFANPADGGEPMRTPPAPNRSEPVLDALPRAPRARMPGLGEGEAQSPAGRAGGRERPRLLGRALAVHS